MERTLVAVLLCLGQFVLETLGNERLICPKIQIGEDDLPGFDLISQFSGLYAPPGVSKVNGSTQYQVAYRLGRGGQFSSPVHELFPRGFPSEYAFVCTLRMLGRSNQKQWYLWMIENKSGEIQAGIRLNGLHRVVEFLSRDERGHVIKVTFNGAAALFDDNWHKIVLSVNSAQVSLYIDCVWIESLPIEKQSLISREGRVSVARKLRSGSVLVEIQWMLLHCDPSRAQRESCRELPTPVSALLLSTSAIPPLTHKKSQKRRIYFQDAITKEVLKTS